MPAHISLPSSPLRAPYEAYQLLVGHQWNDTHPTPPNPYVPAEIRHIGRVSTGKRHTDPQDIAAARESLRGSFNDPRLLKAAGILTLELEERARFLARRGETIKDATVGGKGQARLHEWKARVPLTGATGDVKALVTFSSDFKHRLGGHRLLPHLRYLGVEMGRGEPEDEEHGWVHTAFYSTLLDLAHPDMASQQQVSIHGGDLVCVFGMSDAIRYAENAYRTPRGARAGGLSRQLYPKHIMHEDMAAPVSDVHLDHEPHLLGPR